MKPKLVNDENGCPAMAVDVPVTEQCRRLDCEFRRMSCADYCRAHELERRSVERADELRQAGIAASRQRRPLQKLVRLAAGQTMGRDDIASAIRRGGLIDG